MVKYFIKQNGDGEQVIDFNKVSFVMDWAKLLAVIGAVAVACKMYYQFEAKCEDHQRYDWNLWHEQRMAQAMREENNFAVKVPDVFKIKAQVDAEHR